MITSSTRYLQHMLGKCCCDHYNLLVYSRYWSRILYSCQLFFSPVYYTCYQLLWSALVHRPHCYLYCSKSIIPFAQYRDYKLLVKTDGFQLTTHSTAFALYVRRLTSISKVGNGMIRLHIVTMHKHNSDNMVNES